jgi:hypothetical protein
VMDENPLLKLETAVGHVRTFCDKLLADAKSSRSMLDEEMLTWAREQRLVNVNGQDASRLM